MFIDVQPALVKVAGYVPPPRVGLCRNCICKSESPHGPDALPGTEDDLQYKEYRLNNGLEVLVPPATLYNPVANPPGYIRGIRPIAFSLASFPVPGNGATPPYPYPQ